MAGAAPIITINLEAYPKLSSLEGIGAAIVELYVQTCYEKNSEDKGIPLLVFNLEKILNLVLQGKSIGLIFNTAAPITSKTGHCLFLTSHRDILNAETVYFPTAPPPVIIARRPLFQEAAQ